MLNVFEYGFCLLLGQLSSDKWTSQMDFFAPHLLDGKGLSSWSWIPKHTSQNLLWDYLSQELSDYPSPEDEGYLHCAIQCQLF